MPSVRTPSTRYRTVFLDAGGVLVTPNWDRTAAALARQGVVVAPDVLAREEPIVKRELDVAPAVRATNDRQRAYAYFDRILLRLGIPLSAATDAALAEVAAFNDRDGAWDVVTPGAAAALERLRAAPLRTVIVSNSNGRVRAILRRVGLEPLVDLVVDSHEEGVEKPDARLFEIALRKSGADRAATIHCGDLYYVDVTGARAAGLPAVLLDAAGLYADADCPRVASLPEFVDGLLGGAFD
ncbi:MAG TPA: HAD family hydrolase [Vicinamibacterales bacterium]|nr:HAD family hydrolase [Vicinamibacterales bacterium]HPW19536.1 HAD family hydrolase [Vicinamibacterales bacterium]